MNKTQSLTIGLVAHDRMKPDLQEWTAHNVEILAPHRFFATGTTGTLLKGKLPQLDISPLKSGPFGGDQQIGALIAEGQLDMLIFFQDVMTAQPHDVDVKALIRLSVLYEVPVACNRATADMLISSPMFGAKDTMPRYPDVQQSFEGWLRRFS